MNNQKVDDTVWRSVDCAVFWAVNLVLSDAMYDAVDWAVDNPAWTETEVRSVYGTMGDPKHPALQDFLRAARRT